MIRFAHYAHLLSDRPAASILPIFAENGRWQT
jgi:hypothetical protein